MLGRCLSWCCRSKQAGGRCAGCLYEMRSPQTAPCLSHCRWKRWGDGTERAEVIWAVTLVTWCRGKTCASAVSEGMLEPACFFFALLPQGFKSQGAGTCSFLGVRAFPELAALFPCSSNGKNCHRETAGPIKHPGSSFGMMWEAFQSLLPGFVEEPSR